MVFRGWGYNALKRVSTDKVAFVISTGIFVILHCPAYFIGFALHGTFDWAGIISQIVAALIWGLVFCYLLKKSNTLLNPIIAHTFYDLLCLLIIG